MKGSLEAATVPRAEFRSYYGRPLLKEPVWKPEIPFYFFTGGLTGASAALACVADRAGNRPLARRAWITAMAAGTASPVLLITDLGRPERFFNMLRVFKVTSPMSVGSWVVAATSGSATIATAHELFGVPRRAGPVARFAAALLGLPMSTYTAALLANTAVPVWHEARHQLPFVFAGSAAASAGAAATLVTPAASALPARRLTIAGAALELAATQVMEHRLGEIGEPYRRGPAARFAKLGKALTIAGATLVSARSSRRDACTAGAAAVLAGSLLGRWAVFTAGFESARDPKYTVVPQRTRADGHAGVRS